MVEFALLVPVLLLIVGGIIQFGKAFSYWSQMNNVASETARQVVVWHLQTPPYPASPAKDDFRDFAYKRLTGSELQGLVKPGATVDENHIKICFANGATKGEEAKVIIKTENMAILPFVDISPFNLTSSATMRIETDPPAGTVSDGSC